MIGFHINSPLDGITHYTYGDEAWRVTVSPLGSGAIYSNRHAHAFFGLSSKRGEICAEDYIDHPGDIAIFARMHLILAATPAGERFTLNSAQVQALIARTERQP